MVMPIHRHNLDRLLQYFPLYRERILSVSLVLMLSLLSPSLWAQVKASTDRTVLSIDETVALKIQSKNGSGEPDLTVLEKDFQIMGTSQSQNFSLINGKASQTFTWSINLLPLKTGEVTIPAIKVGQESTAPIHLVIKQPSNNPGLDGKEVFLKIELSESERQYVQQQIIVRVQLFHRIRFVNASLSDLVLENTVVEKLGEDRSYSKTVSKHRYNVIERVYAIFPQQSGSLTIPAITFTGNTEISQNFSLFSRPGRQIISRTQPVTLNILPIPEEYTGTYWLPAETVQLESEILEDPDNITAGEAITRHIVVRATGLLGSQLPSNNMASSSQFKTYPDKEKLGTQLVTGNVLGIRRDAIAIIPLKEGPFTLPEIKIDWWNTRTNQQETITLPARTLFAKRNTDLTSSISEQQAPAAPKAVESEARADQPSSQDARVKELLPQQTPVTKNLWFWVSLLLLILWLTTLALLFSLKGRATPTKRNTASADTIDHEQYLQQLYHACQAHDPSQASKALTQWSKYYFKQPMLSGVAQIIELTHDEALINAINILEQCQYSAGKQNWNGDSLKSVIEDFIKREKFLADQSSHDKQVFVPLNPG